MKLSSKLFANAVVCSLLLAAGSLRADDVKSYQVTGPVLELSDSKIVVQKGSDRWELVRTPGTKVDGDLKVGAKVTIHYIMTAGDVKVQPDKKK